MGSFDRAGSAEGSKKGGMLVLGYHPFIPFSPPANLSTKVVCKPPSLLSPSSVIYPSTRRKSEPTSLKCSCIKNQELNDSLESFSVLETDIPWDHGSIWSTMALYFFSLHIPLSFGGLSVVAHILHQPVLDLQAEALSLLVIQTIELTGALLLLRWNAKPQYKLSRFFSSDKYPKQRNWVLASAFGLGLLIFVVFLTSLLADLTIGPKAVNNQTLKEILSSGNISVIACIIVYCVVTPMLEETVYRGYLLTCLASKMKWQQAVFISSAIFSAAHLSGENTLQLFIIGCVLGCSYCWSGNLSASTAIHSLYNAMTLVFTFLA